MPTIIPGVASDETVSVKWVPTIADPTQPKLATEINAATSVDLTCLLTEPWGPDYSVAVAEIKRMCSKVATQRGGAITYTFPDFIYAYDSQALATAGINKAYAALVQGATGFIVVRYGKQVDTAWAVGDKVDVWNAQITAGPLKLIPEANSELKAKSSAVNIGTPQFDKAVAA